MRYYTFREYVRGTTQVGIGVGVVSLLARWATGNPVLTSPEALVKYGIFGGIGYAFMGAIALMVFGFLGKGIRSECPQGQTIGDYFASKLPPYGYRLLLFLFILTSLDAMFLQGVAAGKLLHILFNIPISMGLLSFLVFCIVYAGFGGMTSIHRFAILQIILMFAAVILIPVYFFVREGVGHVYDGMRLYHPYLLVLNNTDILAFMVTGSLISLGQIFMDRSTWQRLYLMEERNIVPTFLVTGMIWTVFPLAFSSILMIAIFTGGFKSIYSLLFDLIDQIHSPFLLVLFVISLVSAMTSTFGAELHSLVSLIVKNICKAFKPEMTEKQLIYTVFLISVVIGAFFFPVFLFFTPTLLDLLFFFGVIYAAVLPPIVTIIFTKGKVDSFIPFSSLPSMGISYSMKSDTGDLTAIWLSVMTSTIIIVFYLGGKKMMQRMCN